MFVKPRLLFGLAALGLVLTSSTQAGAETVQPSLGVIKPTIGAALDAYQRAGCDHSRTADCIALGSILDADDVFTTATTTPMSIGMPNEKGWAIVRRITRPSLIRRRLQQVFLGHTDRFPAICARIKSFASLFEESGPGKGDFLFINYMIQMAALMDTKTHGHCLPEVLAVLPHTPTDDRLAERARGFCIGSQWETPACKRITR